MWNIVVALVNVLVATLGVFFSWVLVRKQDRTRVAKVVMGVLITATCVASGLLSYGNAHLEKKRLLSLRLATPSGLEGMLRLQRNIQQERFHRYGNEVLERMKRELRGLRGDPETRITEIIAAYLREYEEKDIFGQLPSPGREKDLYDWVENWQDTHVPPSNRKRCLDVIQAVVREECERFPDLLGAAMAGDEDKIIMEWGKLKVTGQTFFDRLIIEKAAALLDSDCVKAYAEAYQKAVE